MTIRRNGKAHPITTWTCEAGAFSGFEADGCAHATGIRYALSERWGAPAPYVYGKGVHSCTDPAPFAVQLPSVLEASLFGTAYERLPQEENCQYLSITMPAGTLPTDNLPVMVWLHGGAYRNGGCDNPAYDRSALAREGGVIVVGVNYRLSILGFSRDEIGKPANNGLLDILEALSHICCHHCIYSSVGRCCDMVDSKIDAVDALNNVVSDLVGASDALCYRATIKGDDLSSMLSRVLDANVKTLREVSSWLEASLKAPTAP